MALIVAGRLNQQVGSALGISEIAAKKLSALHTAALARRSGAYRRPGAPRCAKAAP